MIYITVLDQNNVQLGTFTQPQIAQKLAAGEITESNLAFTAGMDAWKPLGEVLQRAHQQGGRPLIASTAPKGRKVSVGSFEYAGFWRRFLALIIDGIILGLICIALIALMAFCNIGSFRDADGKPHFTNRLPVYFLFLLVRFLYFTLSESGSNQATPGKQMMGISVTDLEGNRISFGRASIRYFAKILSSILFIGYILAAFTPRKQALHDLLARTLVVK